MGVLNSSHDLQLNRATKSLEQSVTEELKKLWRKQTVTSEGTTSPIPFRHMNSR